jgi:hypothetical protein
MKSKCVLEQNSKLKPTWKLSHELNSFNKLCHVLVSFYHSVTAQMRTERLKTEGLIDDFREHFIKQHWLISPWRKRSGNCLQEFVMELNRYMRDHHSMWSTKEMPVLISWFWLKDNDIYSFLLCSFSSDCCLFQCGAMYLTVARPYYP